MLLDNKGIHILVPIVFALILNFIIFIKKWEDTRKNTLLPSGPYVGLIWMIIFVSLGNAHYLLYKKSKVTFASLFLIGVMLFCISYPIITQLDRKKGVIMNVIAFILTSILLLFVYQESIEAFIYILPLFVWISYVNYSDAVVCSGAFKIKSNKPKVKRKKNDNSPKIIVL